MYTLDTRTIPGSLAGTALTEVEWRIYASVNQVTIGPDNGLSPNRHQAIIWTNADLLSIRTLGINFSEILIEMHIFSFKKTYLKMSSIKWRPFYLRLNMLTMIQSLIGCWLVLAELIYMSQIALHGSIFSMFLTVKNMENMLPCNAICDIMHIDFSRKIYCKMMHPLAFDRNSLSQMKAHKMWMFGMFWNILR